MFFQFLIYRFEMRRRVYRGLSPNRYYFYLLLFFLKTGGVHGLSYPVAVSVTIPVLVQISNLSDITLLPTSFANSIAGNTTACIYTNNITPLESYFVTATSTNALSGSFRVFSSATSKYITYSAFWSNTSSPTQTLSLGSA